MHERGAKKTGVKKVGHRIAGYRHFGVAQVGKGAFLFAEVGTTQLLVVRGEH